MNFPDLDRITINPRVMGGKLCIRGIRITVGTITGLLSTGKTNEEILNLYPDLEIRGYLRSIGLCYIEALNMVSRELESRALVTVGPKRHRIRLLPLRN